MCSPQSIQISRCWSVLQEENVRRKQAASGRKRGADAQAGGDSKRPRQAGQQWWAKNEIAADGGNFQDDDDRQAYLEQVGTAMLHISSRGGGWSCRSILNIVLQWWAASRLQPTFHTDGVMV